MHNTNKEKNNEIVHAVFAWDGIEKEDKELLVKYNINTILLDINHTDNIEYYSDYNILLLAGDVNYGVDEMNETINKAKQLNINGVILDIENDYSQLADNLEKINSSIPLYVCIPYWLDTIDNGEEILTRIVKACDGIYVANYLKENERSQIEKEIELCSNYNKQIVTIYELQQPGTYDLNEYNTYYNDGIEAVNKNYEEMFGDTTVGIAYHNLKMIKELQ